MDRQYRDCEGKLQHCAGGLRQVATPCYLLHLSHFWPAYGKNRKRFRGCCTGVTRFWKNDIRNLIPGAWCCQCGVGWKAPPSSVQQLKELAMKLKHGFNLLLRVLFFRTGGRAAAGVYKVDVPKVKELKVLGRRKPFTFPAGVVYLFEEGARAICLLCWGGKKKRERSKEVKKLAIVP